MSASSVIDARRSSAKAWLSMGRTVSHEEMTLDTLAVFMVFGMPVAIVGMTQYFKFKRLQLEAGRGNPAAQKQLEELMAIRKQLEGRVQNLESIVCSVDLELNARLNRLAAQQSA